MDGTYEFYVTQKHRAPRFVPVTCRDTQLLQRAQELLKTEQAESIEVRQLDRVLFTILA